MLPALCLERNDIAAFHYQDILFGIRMNISYEMYVRMILYFFKIILFDRKQQFIILSTIQRAGKRIKLEFNCRVEWWRGL